MHALPETLFRGRRTTAHGDGCCAGDFLFLRAGLDSFLRDSGCCLVDGCYLRLARYDETLIVECEVVKAVPFCGEKKGM